MNNWVFNLKMSQIFQVNFSEMTQYLVVMWNKRQQSLIVILKDTWNLLGCVNELRIVPVHILLEIDGCVFTEDLNLLTVLQEIIVHITSRAYVKNIWEDQKIQSLINQHIMSNIPLIFSIQVHCHKGELSVQRKQEIKC